MIIVVLFALITKRLPRGETGATKQPLLPQITYMFRYRKFPEKSAELFRSHRLVIYQNVRWGQAWRCSQVVKEIVVILVFL